jgi:hypothetical protein
MVRSSWLVLGALLVAAGAGAQEYSRPDTQQSGALVANTDTPLCFTVMGTRWATVRWSVASGAGTVQITAETTGDSTGCGAPNFIAAPYSKRIDASSANPAHSAVANAAASGFAGQTLETPLPANATAFRLRPQTSGTTATFTIGDGLAYSKQPVVAVLYDVTSGSNAVNNPGVLDLTGWTGLQTLATTSGATTGTLTLWTTDNAGNDVGSGAVLTVPAGSVEVYGAWGWGPQTQTIGGRVFNALGQMPQRGHIQVAAIVAQPSRLRIEASR